MAEVSDSAPAVPSWFQRSGDQISSAPEAPVTITLRSSPPSSRRCGRSRTRPCESGVTSSAWEAKCRRRSRRRRRQQPATPDDPPSGRTPRPEGSLAMVERGDEGPLGQLRAEGRGKDESTLLVERVLEVAHESGHRSSPSRYVNRLRPGASVDAWTRDLPWALVAPRIPLVLHIAPPYSPSSISQAFPPRNTGPNACSGRKGARPRFERDTLSFAPRRRSRQPGAARDQPSARINAASTSASWISPTASARTASGPSWPRRPSTASAVTTGDGPSSAAESSRGSGAG